jgi:methanogenic corrinoid protein MtbC1
MRKTLIDFATDPIYNMKAVEQQTGISAPTLRAWERRYQLIEPQRTPGRYRLYSERDVALLRWVRDRMNEGLTISRVAAMLESMQSNDEPIWIEDNAKSSAPTPSPSVSEGPNPPQRLVRPLYEALVEMDEDRADQVMEQAFALYAMSTIYIEVITPALVEMGEAWHRGEIFISSEHFATSYMRGRLLGLMKAYPNRVDMPVVFVGCAQHEHHEIGALIFALMLRQEGFNVTYLGQDIPIDDLIQTAIQERPAMVCISAASPFTAHTLQDVQAKLNAAAAPAPLFVYGGRAFDQDPSLRVLVPGHYLGSDPRQSIAMIYALLQDGRR